MNFIEPQNQTKLYGLDKFISELFKLYENNNLPTKILLSGQKGLGKSTLAYHFINYVLSKDEEFKYDIKSFEINPDNQSFKTILNKSNMNLSVVDVDPEKKTIDIDQIRKLILSLNKSSFNSKPRFVLIDNIEFLNANSINALLKTIEEPNLNIYFILINNNKKILPTLISRCINFKIYLSNKESLEIANQLLNGELFEKINKDIINYYISPGNIYNLVKIGIIYNYDLHDFDLKKLIKILIKENHYKSNSLNKYIIFDLIEFYFRKIDFSFSQNIYEKYLYFLKRISETKKFNLDEESLFIEFEEIMLNE
tara:strand:- start:15 stop:947 length:933 start_codon:yes stop_codon:yes gene_type:complete